MNIKVLGISTSPRSNGNSELLLKQALEGAKEAGAEIEYARLSDYNIGPCIECNACYETGICRINDDYPKLLEKMAKADALVFAIPVFFMSVCAQAKILIDRGQCFWARKYVLKKTELLAGHEQRAMVIAVGGSKSKKQFECVRLTMKTYFDAIGVDYAVNLFVNQVDSVGEIKEHPLAMKEAYRLGQELAKMNKPPVKPITIELWMDFFDST